MIQAAAVFLPLAASGQNLDPTVEVSREYEGKLMEVHKPQLRMEVPDSVLHFDLEFDYTVTEKPYKGSYEFSPYTVDMRPAPTMRDPNSFYFKLGAGYQLHPELDMIWSPQFKKPFRMNVYASNRSFVGRYWNMAEPDLNAAEPLVDRVSRDADDKSWKGYDFVTRAGVDGRYDWEKGLFRFDVGYKGIQQSDEMITRTDRSYNALNVNLGAASKKAEGFLYKVDASYGFANDRFSYAGGTGDDQIAVEFDFGTTLGYAFRNAGKLLVDIGADWGKMEGNQFYDGIDLDIVPHYVMDYGRWHFDLGVRVSGTSHTSRFTDVWEVSRQVVYPDVRIDFKAIEDAMRLYLDLGGDSKLNKYSDILEFNHHATSDYGRLSWELMGISEERLDAALGLEGRIGPRFSYDLRGGYVNGQTVLLDGVELAGADAGLPAHWLPALGYGSFDKAYVSAGWFLEGESVRFDGGLVYTHSWPKQKYNLDGLFLPAALAGDVSFSYIWKKRVSAGIDCEFSSARKSSVARLPGYADLGLNAEYCVNRKFSVWARGGNLLGMTVQRSILYAEKGPYFTLGICLNL